MGSGSQHRRATLPSGSARDHGRRGGEGSAYSSLPRLSRPTDGHAVVSEAGSRLMPERQVCAQMSGGGNPLVLRRGFPSREAAEDHPVKLALWARVWVEERKESLHKP